MCCCSGKGKEIKFLKTSETLKILRDKKKANSWQKISSPVCIKVSQFVQCVFSYWTEVCCTFLIKGFMLLCIVIEVQFLHFVHCQLTGTEAPCSLCTWLELRHPVHCAPDWSWGTVHCQLTGSEAPCSLCTWLVLRHCSLSTDWSWGIVHCAPD